MDQKSIEKSEGFKIEIEYAGIPYRGFTYYLTNDIEIQGILPSDKFCLYLVYADDYWNVRFDTLGENTITNRYSGWVNLKNYGIFYLKRVEDMIDLCYSHNLDLPIKRLFIINIKEKP